MPVRLRILLLISCQGNIIILFIFSTIGWIGVISRLLSSLWTQSFEPFYSGHHFWLVPFIVPHFGGLLAVFTYKFGIVRLNQKTEETGEIEESEMVKDV